jgi:hypothetical protein
MTKLNKIKFAWKYRKPLWRYRKLIRHRWEIAAAAMAGAGIIVGILSRRPRIESLSAQRG